jgi:2-hydroxy-6-oxonona-2,4-dienedioate hydrolase
MTGDSQTDSAMSVLKHLQAGAVVHGTPCDHGVLAWQEWTRLSTPSVSTPSPSTRPLLLLHGGFGSWTHWAANIPGLRQQRDVWTVDMPGLGDSADCPEPHTPEHFAGVILKGFDSLAGAEAEFDLAGFSFGALIGARVAVLAGSRCRRFIAIGAAGCGDLHVQVRLQRPPTPKTSPAEAHSIHSCNLRSLMFASNDSIDELAIHIHDRNLARARFNSRKLSLTDDFLRALPLIKASLVGVWGSRDATAGGREAIGKRRDLFQAAQTGASFHILDGVGHWAMYEAPEAVNQILLDT